MDFIQKAKSSLKDLEGDLNKATAAFHLNDKKGESSAAAPALGHAPPVTSSEASTPAPSNANTPSTSVAPSTVNDGPKTKLPLVVRKNVRDNWENKQSELEAKLSKILGVPWKASIDPARLYSFAEDSYAKDNLGRMITEYFEGAIFQIEHFVEKYGEEGKIELNRVASAHTITIEPTTNPKISYSGCEISGGYLRLLFANKALGTNVQSAAENISKAINDAGVASASSGDGGGEIALDFDAKSSIREDWDPKVAELQARIQKLLALPVLTLTPNFDANFSAISAYDQSLKRADSFLYQWQRSFGMHTYLYFEGFADKLEYHGFGSDSMLQEGFQEGVEKNEIGLRVVPKLEKATYNECGVENGVCWMQTTPEYWNTNIADPANKLLDIL